MILLLYALIGIIVGFVGGMFSLGGGIFIVPTLGFIFASQAVPLEHATRVTVATSQAVIFFVAISSFIAHWRAKTLQLDVIRVVIPTVLIGGVTGFFVVSRMPVLLLQCCFVIALACSIFSIIKNNNEDPHIQIPTSFSGFVLPISAILTLSVAAGIGSGGIVSGYFSAKGVALKRIVGAVILIMLPSSCIATLFFLFGGGITDIPNTIGFVYYPAVIGIAPTAIITAQIGAKFGRKLPAQTLRKLLVLLLLFVECVTIYKIIRTYNGM